MDGTYPAPVPTIDVKEYCFVQRNSIEEIKEKIRWLRDSQRAQMPGEIGANITLAYRHLEDARMRLGKAVQALDGGESCYPR
jgi:hypothetical protein